MFAYTLQTYIITYSCYIWHAVTDINECVTGVHNCTQSQQCVNRPGSFVCECASGYESSNGVCEGKYLYVHTYVLCHLRT